MKKKTVRQAVKEITALIPRLMTSIKAGMFIPQHVSASQITVLMALFKFKMCTVGFLARELNVSDPTITGIIDRLVRLKYVIRRRSINDRRVVMMSLTGKGEKVIKDINKVVEERWSKILAHLSDKERKDYLRLMKKITQIAEVELKKK